MRLETLQFGEADKIWEKLISGWLNNVFVR
jgi:hypothetical protein